MTEVKDGGAAFPGCVRNTKGKLDRNPGMSLRDWFAGQAIAGLTTHCDNEGWSLWTGGPAGRAELAVEAYKMADAMLEVRENNND